MSIDIISTIFRNRVNVLCYVASLWNPLAAGLNTFIFFWLNMVHSMTVSYVDHIYIEVPKNSPLHIIMSVTNKVTYIFGR